MALNPTEFVQVVTTCNVREPLVRMAHQLVTQRWVACAQIEGPVTSVFRWQGAIESAEEYRCTLKTTTDRLAEITSYLLTEHPYDVPELVVVPIIDGSESYLGWLRAQTTDDFELG